MPARSGVHRTGAAGPGAGCACITQSDEVNYLPLSSTYVHWAGAGAGAGARHTGCCAAHAIPHHCCMMLAVPTLLHACARLPPSPQPPPNVQPVDDAQLLDAMQVCQAHLDERVVDSEVLGQLDLWQAVLQHQLPAPSTQVHGSYAQVYIAPRFRHICPAHSPALPGCTHAASTGHIDGTAGGFRLAGFGTWIMPAPHRMVGAPSLTVPSRGMPRACMALSILAHHLRSTPAPSVRLEPSLGRYSPWRTTKTSE